MDASLTPAVATTATLLWLTASDTSASRDHGRARSTTLRPSARRRQMETKIASCTVWHSSRNVNRLSTLVDDIDWTFKLRNFKARHDDSVWRKVRTGMIFDFTLPVPRWEGHCRRMLCSPHQHREERHESKCEQNQGFNKRECQNVRQKAVRWPCGVCRKGVGSKSLQCTSC